MSPTILKVAAGSAAIVIAAFIPHAARGQSRDYTAPRNAVVNAAGAKAVRIDAAAGFLHINGKPGTSEVRITGEAISSDRRWLDQIKLIAERRGDEVFIKADMPDHDRSFWDYMRGDYNMALDLTIDVPVNLAVDVNDGSGELRILGTGAVDVNDGSGEIEIRGITGNARVHDGSGNISLRGIGGDVYVDDGSGNIDADNVTGNFTVGSDGSGNINVVGVAGTMRVDDDGSGEINVDRVGGDFVVDSKGSGTIDYQTVKGKVDIPERKYHRRRGI
jgi:hypothetical protein